MRALLFLLLLFTLPLAAQERILTYDSDLRLSAEGNMTVTETIRVVAEGDDIKRGIYRDLDKRRTHRYEVLSVTRDGAEEPYKTQKKGSRLRVRIGDKNRRLEVGTYTYVLRYRAGQDVHRLAGGADEFSWQVTGTRWKFPVESATTTLHLPPGAAVTNYSCYTGERDSQAHDCATTQPNDSTLTFRTTTALGKREGLTVAVAFAPGVFATRMPPPPPPPWKREAGLYLLILGSMAYLFYAFESWSRHGRDPVPPRIGQQFGPPEGWSAASVGYLINTTDTTAHFTASLLALATRGYLSIVPEEVPGKKKVVYHLRRTDRPLPDDLPPEETLLYNQLFATTGDVRLSAKYDKQLGELRAAHGRKLYELHKELLWQGTNWKLSLPLLAIYLVTSLGSLFLAGASSTPNFMKYAVLFTIFGMIGLCVYLYLIGRPSPAKQRLLLRLKSLRSYLRMSENNRRQLSNAPDMDVAHYEELLPYAVALSVNNKWSAYFGNLMQDDYRPVYGVGVFSATDFSKQFRSAVSTSVSDPSGGMSGGGGSVGGGGGGGGGGGW